MDQQILNSLFGYHCTGVIHETFPERELDVKSLKGLVFYILHHQVRDSYTDTGDSMGVPKTCLYDCPWKERYVAVRQNSKSWFNSSGLRDVREGRESLDCKRRLATLAASFTGTFVNNETTSKETRTSSS